jgi:hypothetical protein
VRHAGIVESALRASPGFGIRQMTAQSGSSASTRTVWQRTEVLPVFCPPIRPRPSVLSIDRIPTGPRSSRSSAWPGSREIAGGASTRGTAERVTATVVRPGLGSRHRPASSEEE